MKSKLYMALTLYLSNEIKTRTAKYCETIPLNAIYYVLASLPNTPKIQSSH
jgi:hypothetical protein